MSDVEQDPSENNNPDAHPDKETVFDEQVPERNQPSTIHTQPLKDSNVFEYDPDAPTRISDRYDKETRSTISQDPNYTPATARSTPEELELAKIPPLPDYSYQSFIGRGGMGVVIRAEDKRLNREVAIKLPLPQFLEDDHFRERFLREARSVAALRHPNICPIYDFGQHGNQLYLVMPYIEGMTLDDWIYDHEHDARQTAEMLAAVADAVAAAHQSEIIHRDLKPSNVLVDKKNMQPLLMDFGLAKQTADENASLLTQDGQIVGTPAYMSPEQARGSRDVDATADIYSLGTMLYEMLCKQQPYQGGMRQILLELDDGPPPPPKKINSKIHVDLETICLKAMQRLPKDRYAAATELAIDLRRFASGESIVARRLGWDKRFINFYNRHKISLSAGILAALLFISSLIWISQKAGQLQGLTEIQQELAAANPSSLIHNQERHAINEKIVALSQLDHEAAQQLHQRYVQLLRDTFDHYIRQSRIDQETTQQLQHLITDIRSSNNSIAKDLESALEQRLHSWQLIGQLAADQKQWLAHNNGVQAATPQLQSSGLIAHGDFKAYIAWSDWDQKQALHVSFHDQQKLLYRVSLSQQSYHEDQDLEWELVLTRADSTLIFWPIAKPPANVALQISCEQGQFIIGYQKREYRYRDLFPLPLAHAELWLEQDKQTVIENAELHERAIASNSSALERGDNLFVQGKWKEAADAYHQKTIDAENSQIRFEAMYKHASCQLKLGNTEVAHDIFGKILNSDSKEWGPLAGCQLWASLLELGQVAEAEHVASILDLQYDRATITANLPFELQIRIRRYYLKASTGAGILVPDENRVLGLKNLVKVNEMLSRNPRVIGLSYYMYIRALHWEQQYELALNTCYDYLDLHGDAESMWTGHIVAEIAWLLRLRGQSAEALEMMERYQQRIQIDRHHRFLFSPEYARCLIELGRNDEAYEHLLSIDMDQIKSGWYHLYADIYTLLAELCNDKQERQSYYELAKPSTWRNQATERKKLLSGFSSYYALLCSQHEDDPQEAMKTIRNFTNQHVGRHGDGNAFSSLFRNININQTVLTDMWNSPRGKMVQSDLIFRRHDFRITTRSLLCLFAYAEIKLRVFPNGVDEQHDQLVWEMCEQSFEHFQNQRLDMKCIISLALAYKGVTNSLGWGYAKDAIPSDIKSSIAYLLYLQNKKKGQTEAAREYLRFTKIHLIAGSTLSKILNASTD